MQSTHRDRERARVPLNVCQEDPHVGFTFRTVSANVFSVRACVLIHLEAWMDEGDRGEVCICENTDSHLQRWGDGLHYVASHSSSSSSSWGCQVRHWKHISRRFQRETEKNGDFCLCWFSQYAYNFIRCETCLGGRSKYCIIIIYVFT